MELGHAGKGTLRERRSRPCARGALPGSSAGTCSARQPGRTLASSVRRLKQPCRDFMLLSFSCLCKALMMLGTCSLEKKTRNVSVAPAGSAQRGATRAACSAEPEAPTAQQGTRRGQQGTRRGQQEAVPLSTREWTRDRLQDSAQEEKLHEQKSWRGR